MVRSLLLAAAALAPAVSAAQTQQDLVVGYWECRADVEGVVTVTAKIEYLPDGRSSYFGAVNGAPAPDQSFSAAFVSEGRWRLEGGLFVEDMTSVTLLEFEINGVHLAPSGLQADFERDMLATDRSQIVQLDATTLVLDTGGAATSCARL